MCSTTQFRVSRFAKIEGKHSSTWGRESVEHEGDEACGDGDQALAGAADDGGADDEGGGTLEAAIPDATFDQIKEKLLGESCMRRKTPEEKDLIFQMIRDVLVGDRWRMYLADTSEGDTAFSSLVVQTLKQLDNERLLGPSGIGTTYSGTPEYTKSQELLNMHLSVGALLY